MNILHRSFLMLTCTVFFLSGSTAQVLTDTLLCGTDTLYISLDNYQFGKVSWEESADGTHWVPIENEFDTVFRYYTAEEKYIRASITSADCDPVYSHRVFIRQVPEAYAGEDKDVMMRHIQLNGNRIEGASASWEVLGESGGVFTDSLSSSPVFSFGETESRFQIAYRLENQCGSSTDTLTVNFVENTYNQNHIVINPSDTIDYSRSDTLSGVYCISFEYMEGVNVKDSVVLVSGAGNGFLRKVSSYEQVDENTFIFHTIQGNLSDILNDGILNLGFDFPDETVLTKSTGNAFMLDHLPTRKELISNPKYKEGVFIYRYPEKYSYSPVVKAASEKKGGIAFSKEDSLLIGDRDGNYLDVKLGGEFRFDPNFVCDVKVGFFKLNYLKVGMENAELETGISVDLKGYYYAELDSIAGKSLRKNLYKKQKPYVVVAGGIPIVVLNTFNVDFIAKPKLEANLDAYYSWNRSSSFSAYLYKEGNTGIHSVYEQGPVISNTDYAVHFNGSAGVDLTLEPKVDFRLYGVLGPYLAVPLTLGPEVCGDASTSGEGSFGTWGINVPLTIDARIGCALKIKKWTLFDRSLTLNLYSTGFYYPNSIGITSGNNQQALPAERLARPLEVQMKTTWGFPAPQIPVYFKLVEGDAILENNYAFTDSKGIASTNLTLGSSSYNRVQVEAFNCDLGYLQGGENLFFEVNAACKNSSLALSLDFREDETVQLRGVMGRAPYTYYLGEEKFDEANPAPGVYEVIGQPLYVVDADGCMETNMVSAMDTCRYSKLSVAVYQESTNASVLGENGTPPYAYSLDDEFNYSSNYEFSYLNPGEHEVYIRDNSGCVSSTEFLVEMGITDSLIAFYPFNGNARDESGRFHHGLADGAGLVPDRFGNQNSSYRFDASDLITVPSSEDFTMEADFSISFWSWSGYDPSKASQYPVSFGDVEDSNGLHLVFESSDACPLNLFVERGNTELCFSDQISKYRSQEWHHFVLMRKRDTLSLYCDAVPLGKMEVKGQLFESCDLHLGNSSGKENGLRGGLDDIRIYNRILYASEIYDLFNENGWDDGILSNVYTDSRDQNVYNQVLIGDQVWMTENLKWLPGVCSGDSDCGYHVYNYPGADPGEAAERMEYNTYGVLYDYEQAADACPDGWHMPEQSEWEELIGFIAGEEGYVDYSHPVYSSIGYHFKSDHGWNAGEGGSDDYSFSALPGGKRSISLFEHLGSSAYWWMRRNQEWGEDQFPFVRLSEYIDLIMEANFYGENSKSLRCIRDEGEVMLPVIYTDTIEAIGCHTARSGGFVQDFGGDTLTAWGICWSTLPKPGADLATKSSGPVGIGYFSSEISGLDPETTYYVRAYATNGAGTAYGNELSFTTAPQLVDIDQNIYNTVYIGEQLWMEENLRTSRYSDGSPILKVVDEFTFGWSQSEGEYAWYANDSASYESDYGKLYNWTAVNTGNLCPAGWHVPEDSEWTEMEDFLGGENMAGGKLKESGVDHWTSPNTWATNLAGFTALPGGYANVEMGYYNLGEQGYWWSATPDPADPLARAFFRRLSFDSRAIDRTSTDREYVGLSVRCVKD